MIKEILPVARSFAARGNGEQAASVSPALSLLPSTPSKRNHQINISSITQALEAAAVVAIRKN